MGTDPSGGRGYDYRVDDPRVDAEGGLLLILEFVPDSKRTWIQFLGRTARQDRKGQYLTVLLTKDYEQLQGLQEIEDPTEKILDWKDKELRNKITAMEMEKDLGFLAN